MSETTAPVPPRDDRLPNEVRGEGFIRENWARLLAIVVILVPGLWFTLDLIHKGRMDALLERQLLCEERRAFIESKLRADQPTTTERTVSAAQPAASAAPAAADAAEASTRAGQYPHLDNPAQPTREDVRKLAEYYELTRPSAVNPQLRFKDGDISYWKEQGLSARALEREFESRKLVLNRADRAKTTIPSQGDLSHAAKTVQMQMQTTR